MQSRLFVAFLAFSLLGQGCLSTIPASPTTPPPGAQNAEATTPEGVSGEPSPDGFIAFREGFGLLPNPTPLPEDVGTPPTTIFAAPFPPLPSSVTVLREWAPPPSDALLHNLTSALQIPVGMLGEEPVGESVTVRWHDAEGGIWSYDSKNNAVAYMRPDAPAAPVIRLSDTDQAVQAVRSFLLDHGITTNGWGEPEARAASVFFAASRDAYPLVDVAGDLVSAAEWETDAIGKTVIRGRADLATELERSDYPALSDGAVIQRLRAGGTHPIKNASSNTVVTFDHFNLALLPTRTTINGQLRTFHLPVLWARGTVRRGTDVSAYATTVPLVADATFQPGS